jgi:hypothetical protein
MQMALEALEDANDVARMEFSDEDYYSEAITALRQALEEKQEPVAWRYALDASVEGPRWIYIDKDPHQWLQGPAMVNAAIEELHTSPPKREWVGLTDAEIHDMNGYEEDRRMYRFARAIEAKLKEKNHG